MSALEKSLTAQRREATTLRTVLQGVGRSERRRELAQVLVAPPLSTTTPLSPPVAVARGVSGGRSTLVGSETTASSGTATAAAVSAAVGGSGGGNEKLSLGQL